MHFIHTTTLEAETCARIFAARVHVDERWVTTLEAGPAASLPFSMLSPDLSAIQKVCLQGTGFLQSSLLLPKDLYPAPC